VSLLRSASGSGKEHGTRHGARVVSEAGEWLRYDFNSGKLLKRVSEIVSDVLLKKKKRTCSWQFVL
jgi:hypothetical protein